MPHGHSSSGAKPRGPRRPRAVGDLLGRALKDLGLPSARISAQLRQAWELAADEAWRSQTRPLRFEGGVLEVGVGSAALRDELANFHAARLLGVLRAALPDTTFVALRFLADATRSPGRPGGERS